LKELASFFFDHRRNGKMTALRGKLKRYLVGSILLFCVFPLAGDCLTLITPEEAAQPDQPIPRGMKLTRIEGNGPQIKIHSPDLEEPLHNPFVDIAFEASPDKTIDFDTLSIKYLKLISIDLTGRIKPYLDNNRLMVKDVRVPQGKHRVQLLIAYTSGEKTMMEIVLNIEK
jgi:hypothetical protein